jgi:protein translocase SEC61 complex gamma subunit
MTDGSNTAPANKFNKAKNWLSSESQKYVRVWKILRKPSYQEIKNVSKVSAIGLLLIGAVGFLVSLVVNYFMKFVNP